MKTKKFKKKLVLSKKTVANLNEDGMNKLKAGRVSKPESECPGCTAGCPPDK